MYEPTTTSAEHSKCRRCGNTGFILSNGLCSRCDDAMFGKGVKK